MSNQQKLEKIKSIVENWQYSKIEGFIVDGTTAQMLLTIVENLNEVNREKFLSLPITRMVDIGWKLVK
jgi:hypothetical protein